VQGRIEQAFDKTGKMTCADSRDAGVKAHKMAFPHCDEACTKKQLDDCHKNKCGIEEGTELRTDPQAGTRSMGKLTKQQVDEVQQHIDKALGEAGQGTGI
jgi:hypothetical protein